VSAARFSHPIEVRFRDLLRAQDPDVKDEATP